MSDGLDSDFYDELTYDDLIAQIDAKSSVPPTQNLDDDHDDNIDEDFRGNNSTRYRENPVGAILSDAQVTDTEVELAFSKALSGEREQLLIQYLAEFIETLVSDRLAFVGPQKRYTCFDVSRTIGELILTKRKWDIASVTEEVLTEPHHVISLWLPRLYKQSIESLKPANSPPEVVDGIFTCPILCVDVPLSDVVELPCGHMFSRDAFDGYLMSWSKEKSGLLSATCMMSDCGMPMPFALISDLLDETGRNRLHDWRLENFMDAYGIFKCNAPSHGSFCQSLIRSIPQEDVKSNETRKECLETSLAEIECAQGHLCCGLCHISSHCPFPCKYMLAWDAKHSDDSANVQWKICHTKPCPKCGKDIEKNSGCMHITCSCKYEFCWLCLNEWRNHDDWFHPACASFKGKDFEITNLVNAKAEIAKFQLERYNFYAARYDGHMQSAAMIHDIQMTGLVMVEAANKLCVRLDQWDANAPTDIDGNTEQVIHLYKKLKEIFDKRNERREITIINFATTLDSLVQFGAESTDGKERNASYVLLAEMEKALRVLRTCRKFLGCSYAFTYFQDWEATDSESLLKKAKDKVKQLADSRQNETIGLPTATFTNSDKVENLYNYQTARLEMYLEKLNQLTECTTLIFLRRNIDATVSKPDDTPDNSITRYESLSDYVRDLQNSMKSVKECTANLTLKLISGQTLSDYDTDKAALQELIRQHTFIDK